MPGDGDSDGIDDAIDSDPLTASDDFSDQPSGTTFGSIIDRGGLTVRVSDEGDPQGVRVRATGVGGPATVSVCGVTNLTLDPGDDVIVTCSSATIQVLIGPVEATFEGTIVQVPGGQAVTITEVSAGVFEVLADPDNTEEIFVDGAPVGPGDELTVGPLTCNGEGATIVGTDSSETLIGTNGPDVILAKGGDDLIIARGGDDVVCAGEGNDMVVAGSGDDTVLGEEGNDKLIGNNGADDLDGGPGTDVCLGNRGSDTAVNCEFVVSAN